MYVDILGYTGFRVQGPSTQKLGTRVLGNSIIILQVLGKHMIVRYLDP